MRRRKAQWQFIPSAKLRKIGGNGPLAGEPFSQLRVFRTGTASNFVCSQFYKLSPDLLGILKIRKSRMQENPLLQG